MALKALLLGLHREQRYINIYTPVLSNLFDPAGRTRHNHEAAGRTNKLESND